MDTCSGGPQPPPPPECEPVAVAALLSRRERRPSCCGLAALPSPFDRAAPDSFLDPKFDSDILEGQYGASSFPQIRLRFRYALVYVISFYIIWMLYFFLFATEGSEAERSTVCAALATALSCHLLVVAFTFTDTYRDYMHCTSIFTAFVLYALSICLVCMARNGSVGGAGLFIMSAEIVLVVYTTIPMPLYLCAALNILFSITFELTNCYVREWDKSTSHVGTLVRALLQICVHIIGLHILLMIIVRMRGTFMKVGQSLLVRRQLELEKILKEKMIHSVMPPKVADWLMSETGMESESSLKRNNSLYPRNSNPGASDLKSLFRPFNMHCMENVSILFADIVGFTKMSSNKTAEELVDILNDLFKRFDQLCERNNCEKISTLGDCYYCVSGCPEPRPDHARCCVEMGLGMIKAIKVFDEERGEEVNMRVGVHTGTVLCGIVGTKRFKFDVWSNDVSLANKMESTGQPGRVHISEETSRFLTDYILEEGDDVFGHKTYFIEGRQSIERISSSNTVSSVPLKLIISPPHATDAVSPTFTAISPHINVSNANTHGGLTDVTHSLTPPSYNPNHLSPNSFNLKIKANSLPSILDSDHEDDKSNSKKSSDEPSKSPTSIGSYGKYTTKLKGWKIPKFLKKTGLSSENVKIEDLGNGKDFTIGEPGNTDNGGSMNGYQQVPIVIESVDGVPVNNVTLNSNKLCPDQHSQRNSTASAYDNDMLDIKSYISQSRSDVSPFARTSSYRSQYGRTSYVDIPQSGRARSSTIGQLQDLPGLSVNAVPRTVHGEDQISLCPSVNSRKDSGIRSNSRRSSIQQQIYMVSQTALGASQDLQRRVSGYYTSSQSSLARPSLGNNSTQPYNCQHKLRKQSDLELIRCVQDNAKSRSSYFVKPPISPFTLFFKSQDLENEYRETAHRNNERDFDFPPTLASSHFNTYLDVLISATIFLIMSASIFLIYQPTGLWIGVFIICLLFQAVAISLCFHKHMTLSQLYLLKSREENESRIEYVLRRLSKWYPWQVFGAVLVSLPAVAVLVNFSCHNSAFRIVTNEELYFVYLLCVGLMHFCNFTQINLWYKNFLVSLAAIIFIGIAIFYCPYQGQLSIYNHRDQPKVMSVHNISAQTIKALSLNSNMSNSNNAPIGTFNDTKFEDAERTNELYVDPKMANASNFSTPDVSSDSTNISLTDTSQRCPYIRRIYLDVILFVILIWFLNREFEISYRMSFYGNIVANKDKIRVQNMRNQADWLLHNIIPRHVADQLKSKARYSENHKNVAIIFASIVNFNEMYDESYLGGKEYLRVLNELIADFDELLEHPEFQDVDKIKTIGSTFMAASGLNPHMRQENSDPYSHLYSLMDFAIAMQRVVYEFNRDLLEFNLILRVGYNFGDVTAGVIGTSKLFYDIWGDAVNIASRMDSTGVNGRIQVGEACIPILEKKFEFEPRGSVYVKGKDNMNVYLLLRKKPEDDVTL